MLNPRLQFLPLNEEGKDLNLDIREKLSDIIGQIEALSPSREYSLALTKFEEGAMWLTKGLVRSEKYRERK